ncbi:MAG: glycosyl hydrolase [Actinomycetota bacterium]|nr:glycosyl hydrolase [Actinomycetota bacterium]
MEADLLRGAQWALCRTSAGSAENPKRLADLAVDWLPATVPGTVAGALRAAGDPQWRTHDYDASDWWLRCAFDADEDVTSTREYALSIGGIATIADIWLNGEHCWHGENMFRQWTVPVPYLRAGNELHIRCAALGAVLARRRARPRWRTNLVTQQSLRHVRTSLLGRMPGSSAQAAPVGPYRALSLTAQDVPLEVRGRRLSARVLSDVGVLSGSLTLAGIPTGRIVIRVGDTSADIDMRTGATSDTGEWTAQFEVRVPDVHLWWPHTHGDQPLYEVSASMDAHQVRLGRVGFRELDIDTTDGAFTVLVNGVPIFCRGACWSPVEPVTLNPTPEQTFAAIASVREAHMNMLRVPGTSVYEDDAFFDACDELGILVWQDCMLASLEPSEEADVQAEIRVELEQLFERMQGRPCVAVVCGGSEVAQQAAMSGVDRARWDSPTLEEHLPALVERWLPRTRYVPSSPSGGALPFTVDTGVSHYFGVGAYLRPLEDARRAGVRFATECLAFANPPEAVTVEEAFGGPWRAGHHPDWKAAVPRDEGAPWDFDDVRDYYVSELFGVDTVRLRSQDPARYLDLGRAAVAECVTSTFSEWRRAGSTCAGGLILNLRDLVPGAGWGLIDSIGRPKSGWFAARRAFAPITVLTTDEGLNGLRLHVVNDSATALRAALTIRLFVRAQNVETVRQPIVVAGRSVSAFDTAEFFSGFRDLTFAYRFGPCEYDAVSVELHDAYGVLIAEVVHLPARRDIWVEADLGLSAGAELVAGEWTLSCSTKRVARWVSVHVDGFTPADSWFHLVPGITKRLAIRAADDGAHATGPSGYISAINARHPSRIDVRRAEVGS